MRITVFLFALFILGCQTEKKADNVEQPEKSNEEKEIKVKEKILPFTDIIPELKNQTNSVKIEQSGNFGLKIIFENNLGSEELNINVEDLITRISAVSLKTHYHQLLSAYLFEKQVHKIILKDFESAIGTYRYEIVNPSHSPYWQILGYDEKNNLIVAIAFTVPEDIYSKLFKNLNHLDFVKFKPYMNTAPENDKIEYNSIRKMGRFYEGRLTVMNQFSFPKEESLLQEYFFRNNTVENLNFYFKSDFNLPSQEKKGIYDTTNLVSQSLAEFYYIKGFSYKTTYSLINPADSCIEIQIDFKTKNNQETVRMVMGGIIVGKIPVLSNENLYNGLYLPLGFNKVYSNTETSIETYLLMGNSSGSWIDNSYGRNIDGLILHYDKNMKSKLHIWLMSGDGKLPVSHYITTLDQLAK